MAKLLLSCDGISGQTSNYGGEAQIRNAPLMPDNAVDPRENLIESYQHLKSPIACWNETSQDVMFARLASETLRSLSIVLCVVEFMTRWSSEVVSSNELSVNAQFECAKLAWVHLFVNGTDVAPFQDLLAMADIGALTG